MHISPTSILCSRTRISLPLNQDIQPFPRIGVLLPTTTATTSVTPIQPPSSSLLTQNLNINLLNPPRRLHLPLPPLFLLPLTIKIPPNAEERAGLFKDLHFEPAVLVGDEAVRELRPAVRDALDVLDDQVAAAPGGLHFLDPLDALAVQGVELREDEEELCLWVEAVLALAFVGSRRAVVVVVDVGEARAGSGMGSIRDGEVRGHQLGLETPALDEATGGLEAFGSGPFVRQQATVETRVEEQDGDFSPVAPGHGAQPVAVDGRVVLDAQGQIERQVASRAEAREGDALVVEGDAASAFFVEVSVDGFAQGAIALFAAVGDGEHDVLGVEVRGGVCRVRSEAVVDRDDDAVELAAHLRAKGGLFLAAAEDEAAAVKVDQDRIFVALLLLLLLLFVVGGVC